MLASAGVMVGFSGSGGTPLLMATEIEWLSPQSEYRPTEYLQGWMSFWFDDRKRLAAAKQLQQARIEFLNTTWTKDRDLKANGFDSANAEILGVLYQFVHCRAGSLENRFLGCVARMRFTCGYPIR